MAVETKRNDWDTSYRNPISWCNDNKTKEIYPIISNAWKFVGTNESPHTLYKGCDSGRLLQLLGI